MLPFSPYPILLITLNTMLVASSDRIFFFFFTYHPSQDFLFVWGRREGIFTPPPVISNGPPLCTDKSRSPSRPRLRI